MHTSHASNVGDYPIAESRTIDTGQACKAAERAHGDEGVGDQLDEAVSLANDTEYGLTSSVSTTSLSSAKRAVEELSFDETYVNRENFEAKQGFHAGVRKPGIGGADGKHGVYAYTATHVATVQT